MNFKIAEETVTADTVHFTFEEQKSVGAKIAQLIQDEMNKKAGSVSEVIGCLSCALACLSAAEAQMVTQANLEPKELYGYFAMQSESYANLANNLVPRDPVSELLDMVLGLGQVTIIDLG